MDGHKGSYIDSMDDDYYAKNKISIDLQKMIELIEEHISLIGTVRDKEDIIKNLEEYISGINPASYNYESIIENISLNKRFISECTIRISKIIDEVNYIKSEIIQIFNDGLSDNPENEYLKKLFESIYKWYPSQNAIMSGVFIPGDVNEYIPIMTIQPFDTLYPISEVLDYKMDYDKPWVREKIDDSDEEGDYGLHHLSEGRNPFFTYPIDISKDYEPSTNNSDHIVVTEGDLSLDVHHEEDTNIVKDANKTLVHSSSGDVLSGMFILQIIREREDGVGTVNETKPEFTHSESTFSGGYVFGGTSKDVLDRQYYVDMSPEKEPDVSIEIYRDLCLEDFVAIDIDLEVEEFSGMGSIYSVIHSSSRSTFSGNSIFDGRLGYTRRLSPEGSFTHSGRVDGVHSKNAMFSGKSNWMIEPIVDMSSHVEPYIVRDVAIGLEVETYEVNVRLDIVDSEYNEYAINFSSLDSKFSTSKSLHSGNTEKPSENSVVHGISAYSSSGALHDGKFVTS